MGVQFRTLKRATLQGNVEALPCADWQDLDELFGVLTLGEAAQMVIDGELELRWRPELTPERRVG